MTELILAANVFINVDDNYCGNCRFKTIPDRVNQLKPMCVLFEQSIVKDLRTDRCRELFIKPIVESDNSD